MIHGGVRWKTFSAPTTGAISGTNWIAEAPVPMTATRRPVRSRSWRQVAEWNTGPSKESRPGTSGNDGSDSAPEPRTRTSAVQTPWLVVTTQCCASSSQEASSTSWRLRGERAMLYSADTPCREGGVFGCAGKERGQAGVGADEKEERGVGTSRAGPGGG